LAGEEGRRALEGEPSLTLETYRAFSELVNEIFSEAVELPPWHTQGPSTDTPLDTDRSEELLPTDLGDLDRSPGLEFPPVDEGNIFITPDESERFNQP